MKNLNVIQNDTCFACHGRMNLTCEKSSCRHWFESKKHYNCIILHAKGGPEKQEQIGKYFNLTRMRVCQVEKNLLSVLKNSPELKKLK